MPSASNSHAPPSPYVHRAFTEHSEAIHDANSYLHCQSRHDQEPENLIFPTVSLLEPLASAFAQQQPIDDAESFTNLSKSDYDDAGSVHEGEEYHHLQSKPFLPRFSSIACSTAFVGKDESQHPVSAQRLLRPEPVAWRDIPNRSQLVVSSAIFHSKNVNLI